MAHELEKPLHQKLVFEKNLKGCTTSIVIEKTEACQYLGNDTLIFRPQKCLSQCADNWLDFNDRNWLAFSFEEIHEAPC